MQLLCPLFTSFRTEAKNNGQRSGFIKIQRNRMMK